MGIVMDHDLRASPPSSSKEAAEIDVPGGMPVGYRFRPTDVELVKHYLMNKAFNPASPLPAIIGVDIEAFEFCRMTPSDLVPHSRREEREWFFFVHINLESTADQDLEEMKTIREKNGIGFWISGLKKTIYDSTGVPLAYKSEFTYCLASTTSSSRQRKTHWKLDEYRLHSPLNLRGQEWLLARLKRGSDYEKKYS